MSQAKTEITATERATEACKALGLSLKADFVPFSQSRNADTKDKHGNAIFSLNWRVSLRKDDSRGPVAFLLTDYMQGMGHASSAKLRPWPSKNNTRSADAFIAERGLDILIRGEGSSQFWTETTKPIPAPTLIDVVYSLLSDSDVLSCSGFEDWASNLGYDTDSREAEKIYKACLEIGLKLQAVLGHKALEALREAFQDY